MNIRGKTIILFSLIILFSFFIFVKKNEASSVRDEIEKFILDNSEKYKEKRSVQETGEINFSSDKFSVKVPILIYHGMRPHREGDDSLVRFYNVEPIPFERQLKYLRDNGYTSISLDYLSLVLDKKRDLPVNPVIITFDDGWGSQYKYAFPLLKKYNFTATFFIFTNGIDKENFLTSEQIKEMIDAGMTIGAHTVSHGYLFKETDEDKIKKEIIESKKFLEDKFGISVTDFAYPFGHYNDDILKIIKESGFNTARTTYNGIYHTKDDVYILKGFEVSNDFDNFIIILN